MCCDMEQADCVQTICVAVLLSRPDVEQSEPRLVQGSQFESQEQCGLVFDTWAGGNQNVAVPEAANAVETESADGESASTGGHSAAISHRHLLENKKRPASRAGERGLPA
jgi:hypothetical protein